VKRKCLKSRGKLPVDNERLIILVMMMTSIDAQSFSGEVGIGLYMVKYALFVGRRL